MKRFVPFVAAVAGTIILLLVLPLYRPAQPNEIRITRKEARAIADRAAQGVGVRVDQAWATVTWYESPILDKELRQHPRRSQAWNDPVFGPRLDVYRINYWHRGLDKFPGAGYVYIDGRTGEVTSARLRLRNEDAAKGATQAELRPRADAFVRSRKFPGAPSPQFESARSTEFRGRTDWVFRYRIAPTMPLDNVVPYLNVYFSGDRFSGWELAEEYSDGRQFFGESGGGIASTLMQFVTMLVILLILLVMFLRKYHAGEVGVNAASLVFVVMALLCITGSFMIRASQSDQTGMGSISAEATSWAVMSFKVLFIDFPLALILFLAWAVGESYARERWGERLAAFDAILRRDPLNATVGRSLLCGTLFAPAIAAAAMAVGAIPMFFGSAWPSTSGGSTEVLFLGGPLLTLIRASSDALIVSVVCILFLLAWTHRRRFLWLGVIAAIILGAINGVAAPSIEPVMMRLAFGFGGVALAVAVFLGYDLLAAAIALFGGSLLTLIAPLLSVAAGELAQNLTLTLTLPLVGIACFAVAALLTRREVVYSYEDLAPHVKRIVERERVKAEIDAANRIQAALLPQCAPELRGASVASHYRAATEIGGDYFDFLPQPNGEIGIAFGDVSGHGLTSGIVMAMAKSALLVQVDYDSSPRAVMNVLNEVVIKTAPKRMLMTFFFGVLDPHAATLRFSSAGHLDPYVYRAATRRLEALSSWGFPLGVRRREPFREHAVEFLPGDRLVLYSDGLIEAIDDDGEPFGFERFEQTIVASGALSADDMKKALLTAVRKFTRNRPPEDDQTLVVVAFDDAPAALLVDHEVASMPVAETVH